MIRLSVYTAGLAAWAGCSADGLMTLRVLQLLNCSQQNFGISFLIQHIDLTFWRSTNRLAKNEQQVMVAYLMQAWELAWAGTVLCDCLK